MFVLQNLHQAQNFYFFQALDLCGPDTQKWHVAGSGHICCEHVFGHSLADPYRGIIHALLERDLRLSA